jgi:hypothetical protein
MTALAEFEVTDLLSFSLVSQQQFLREAVDCRVTV